MKVLQHGDRKPWSVEVRCVGVDSDVRTDPGNGCRALLLVEAADLFRSGLRRYARHSINIRTLSNVTFRCPECQTLTTLDERDLPPAHILNLLPAQETWEASHEEKQEGRQC